MIAIDVVGVLWTLPACGGPARRLTSDLFDIAQPEWSPDSATITFQSYRDGVFNIWLIHPDGTGLRRLTPAVSGQDDEPASFSPNGDLLAFTRTRHLKTPPAATCRVGCQTFATP